MTTLLHPPVSNTEEIAQLTSLCKILSDRTRVTILYLLMGGERNVTSFCDELKLPQPTVSHHLGLMRQHGILSSRRSGKQVFYWLSGQVDQGHEDQSLTIKTDGLQVIVRRHSHPTPA